MLPAGSFRVVDARSLKVGDFALLHILDHAPTIVVEKNDFILAVMLDGDLTKSHTTVVSELVGQATVVDGWEIEIDHRATEKLDHMDARPGCLSLRGDTLSIVATPPSNFGYVILPIMKLPEKGVDTDFGFRDWRIKKTIGEKDLVLFERNSTGE